MYTQIREDTKTGVYVDNLSEEYVSSVEDVTRLLSKVYLLEWFLILQHTTEMPLH